MPTLRTNYRGSVHTVHCISTVLIQQSPQMQTEIGAPFKLPRKGPSIRSGTCDIDSAICIHFLYRKSSSVVTELAPSLID